MSETGAVYLPHDGAPPPTTGRYSVTRQLYPRLREVFAELSEVTR